MTAHTKKLITKEGNKALRRLERLDSWLVYITNNFLGTAEQILFLRTQKQKELNRLAKLQKRL